MPLCPPHLCSGGYSEVRAAHIRGKPVNLVICCVLLDLLLLVTSLSLFWGIITLEVSSQRRLSSADYAEAGNMTNCTADVMSLLCDNDVTGPAEQQTVSCTMLICWPDRCTGSSSHTQLWHVTASRCNKGVLRCPAGITKSGLCWHAPGSRPAAVHCPGLGRRKCQVGRGKAVAGFAS